ncbi:Peroxisome biogenesis 1 -like protein [Gossypium arboreum]|nr:Peroxisome biogenesis 1 -like protein [Gossypium arboreum]
MIHLMKLPNPEPLIRRPEHGGRDRHACISIRDVSKLQAILDKAGVYLKGYNAALKKEILILSHSPCHFKLVANDNAIGNGLEMLDGHKTHRSQNSLPISGSGTSLGVVNWSTHENVVVALSSEFPCQEVEDFNHQDNKKGLECLLQAWFLAQLDAIASNAGTEVNTLILGSESLLHF